jgi:cation:H+ antiporter
LSTSFAPFALLLGIAGTWLGAELLVRGSSALALRLGVRPLVVGMTVVAFGTSAPEAVASLAAVRMGAPGLALGNVLGSNIANIGLILGILGILHPIEVDRDGIRDELRMLLATTALAVLLALLPPTRGYQFYDGIILLVGLVFFLRHYLLHGRIGKVLDVPAEGENAKGQRGIVPSSLLTAAGLALLIYGATLLVGGARTIAQQLGISEEVIGATVVAVGTSLPELAASVVAVVRGEHEIGVGNLLGSNILNLLFVLGISITMGGRHAEAPGGAIIPYDPASTPLFLIAMCIFTVLVVPILRRHARVERMEAAGLLTLYLIFCVIAYF